MWHLLGGDLTPPENTWLLLRGHDFVRLVAQYNHELRPTLQGDYRWFMPEYEPSRLEISPYVDLASVGLFPTHWAWLPEDAEEGEVSWFGSASVHRSRDGLQVVRRGNLTLAHLQPRVSGLRVVTHAVFETADDFDAMTAALSAARSDLLPREL
jgi:hypothetical protein